MTGKKLIPAMGLKGGQAINFPGQELLPSDPVLLAQSYGDNGADEILLYDASETDEDHDRSIGIMKEIARTVDVPLIVGGRVHRLEDVKKYLYTGADAVFLNLEEESNQNLVKEAADRFGREKIYGMLPRPSLLPHQEEYEMLGISCFLLMSPGGTWDFSLEELQKIHQGNFLLADNMNSDKEIAACLSSPVISGIIGTDLGVNGINCMDWKARLKMLNVPVMTWESAIDWSEFHPSPDGLVPAIIQDYKTNEVLMLAYLNEESYRQTIATGKMTYYSRSRRKLWIKGETSGHYQYVKSLTLDCDNDTVLAKVAQVGVACHTGSRSCFFKPLIQKESKAVNPHAVFENVYSVIADRKIHPKEGSYTNYLFDKGIDKILKKVGEEATELVIAAKNPDPEEIKYEMSDFLYHAMVLMVEKGITWEDITRELANR